MTANETPNSIRVISFDLDDTLWPIKPLFIKAEQGVYQFLLQQAPKLTDQYDAEALFKLRRQFWQQQLELQPQLRHQISKMRILSMQSALQQAGYPESQATEISTACFEHFMTLRHQVELFDHALDTLKQLSQNYTLVALSNGNSCTHRLGLGEYFKLHLSAEQLGIGKPEAEAFEQLLQQSDCSAEQCIHIGDHPKDDIWGAHNAGMRSIWFNPKQQPWQKQDFQPNAVVSCLSEIPAVIDRINTQ